MLILREVLPLATGLPCSQLSILARCDRVPFDPAEVPHTASSDPGVR